MQPEKVAMALLLALGCVYADNPVPDIELLELLGQWQELSDLGVDIDGLLNEPPPPDTDQPDPEQAASNT